MVRRLAPVPSVAAEVHGNGGAGDRTSAELPAHECTCTQSPQGAMPVQYTDHRDGCNFAGSRQNMPEQGGKRTVQSLRAERAYGHWSEMPPTERPLQVTRPLHAAALARVAGERGWTIEGLAKTLGVNERQARKYIEGEAPIPTTILDALPIAQADALLDRIRAVTGRETGAVTDRFMAALDALEKSGASDEFLLVATRRLMAISSRRGQR